MGRIRMIGASSSIVLLMTLLLSYDDCNFLLLSMKSKWPLPLLVFTASVIITNRWKTSKRNKQHRHLPPGSAGMLPIIGETLRLIAAYKTENPEPFTDDRVKLNNSKIFTTHVFGETTVFSADHEFNKLVLAGEGRTFESSYPFSVATLMGKHSLLLMKAGPLHKRLHSLTLTRFSSLSVLRRTLLPEIDRLVSITLDSISDNQLVILDKLAKKITFELTVKQLMGYGPGEWTESLRREYLFLIDGFFSVPFPSFLSFTTYGRAIQVIFLFHLRI